MRFSKGFVRGIFGVFGFGISASIGVTSYAVETARALEFSDLVDPDAKVTQVVDGCEFTEGPAYGPQGFLLFSDIPGDRILQVLPDGKSQDFIKPSNKSNGLMFDQSGALWVCEDHTRRVVRLDLTNGNKSTVLADAYDSKKLNGPNDLALDAYGGVYFTDPVYGQPAPEQPVQGVYYVDVSGKITRVIDDIDRPNGVLVSPTGKYLYVADVNHAKIQRYDILRPGKLSDAELIFTGDAKLDGTRGPDGMASDVHGNVYATFKGITVVDPDGKVIGRIPVPLGPANCAFGGKDGKTLFITAQTKLYSIETKVTGMSLQPSFLPKPRKENLGVLTIDVPETWKKREPKSKMRLAEFEIPPVGGDREAGELVVFYFGTRGAGGLQANVARWVAQFESEGREVRTYSGKATAGSYALVDLAGTYNKPVGPPIQRRSKRTPDARVVNVFLQTEKGDCFLKLAGGKNTVSANLGLLRRAFGADATKETVEKP